MRRLVSGGLWVVAALAVAAGAGPVARADDGHDRDKGNKEGHDEDKDHQGETVRWKDLIGIIQAGNAVGSGTGQVLGGGQPWSTFGGHAKADLDHGTIEFDVEGLVLAGGNAIGTPGAVVEVKGTLVCDTDGSAGGGNSTIVDTPLVPLDGWGDAKFKGKVSIPGVCKAEPDIAFLVRGANQRWFAYGAVLKR